MLLLIERQGEGTEMGGPLEQLWNHVLFQPGHPLNGVLLDTSSSNSYKTFLEPVWSGARTRMEKLEREEMGEEIANLSHTPFIDTETGACYQPDMTRLVVSVVTRQASGPMIFNGKLRNFEGSRTEIEHGSAATLHRAV